MAAFNVQSTRAANENLFGFVDTTDTMGINANVNWAHRFSQHLFVHADLRIQPAKNANRAGV